MRFILLRSACRNIHIVFFARKMASNLTNQVRSISEVTKAVASSYLSKFVDVDVQGEMLDLKTTVNSMVKQMGTLANEVIRMSMNLTDQVRAITLVTKAVAGGDLTKKIEVDVRGEILDLKECQRHDG